MGVVFVEPQGAKVTFQEGDFHPLLDDCSRIELNFLEKVGTVARFF